LYFMDSCCSLFDLKERKGVFVSYTRFAALLAIC
jgi:hypothetical protein